VIFSFICDVSGCCHAFNLLYAAPGDWMGAVFLVQILRVTLIPAVTRTGVHFPTMRCCALTQQHTTCNTHRIQLSGTHRLAKVICSSILRLCGINPALNKAFHHQEQNLLLRGAISYVLRTSNIYKSQNKLPCPLLLPQPTQLRIYVMDFWGMAPHNLTGGH
jgi:hypothetical protein